MMHGVFKWTYETGSFDVELRQSKNVFYCPKYMSSGSTYEFSDNYNKLFINWKKYGTYEFVKSTESTNLFVGNVVGDLQNWRKLEFIRPFTVEEELIFGEYGSGSAWDFQHAGGSFEIQFFTDSFNHFNCPSFPAHSHWKFLSPSKLEINWGKYGIYELEINAADCSMTGHKKDQPANWRKAKHLRSLNPADSSDSSQDHSHNHDH